MTAKKVWAQVEISDDHWNRNKLIDGVEIDKAKEALIDLYRFRPNDGPTEIFNDTNPFYTPRRTLEQVIRDDYKRDPKEIEDLLRSQGQAWRESLATPKRIAQYQTDHSIAYPDEARAKYLQRSFADLEKTIKRVMTQKGLHYNDADRVAKWLDTTPGKLVQATQGDDDAPFFSEAYLYTLVGKEHARSVLGRLSTLAEALGVDLWTIDRSETTNTDDD